MMRACLPSMRNKKTLKLARMRRRKRTRKVKKQMTSGLRHWMKQLELFLEEKTVKNSCWKQEKRKITKPGKKRMTFLVEKRSNSEMLLWHIRSLITVPKTFKAAMNASQERLHLQAVDAYRKCKGCESRLGAKLPLPVTTSPLL